MLLPFLYKLWYTVHKVRILPFAFLKIFLKLILYYRNESYKNSKETCHIPFSLLPLLLESYKL